MRRTPKRSWPMMSLAAFVKRFDIPIPEQAAKDGAFYRPEQDSPEIAYMQERRKELGGYLPARETPKFPMAEFKAPDLAYFKEWTAGSGKRAVSTTMGFVNLLKHLLKDPAIGKLVVPIVPDEGRTFGLESVIRQVGIYAPEGQKYTPHDADMLLFYREAKDGQILEEGITEAGSMASFTAAGTAYSNYRVPAIPFYMYYSMFGFPAHRRHGVGVRGLARQGLPDGRYGGSNDDVRRRTAAPGRALPCAIEHRPDLRHLRSCLRVRTCGGLAGWHPAHVPGGRRRLLLCHHVQRGLRDAGDA